MTEFNPWNVAAVARAEERARIVALIREEANRMRARRGDAPDDTTAFAVGAAEGALNGVADRIERGEGENE